MNKLETELKDRVLRFDGVSIIEPENVYDFFLRGVKPSQLLVKESNEEVEKFNLQVAEQDKIQLVGASPIKISAEWRLPDENKTLDVDYVVGVKFEQFIKTADYTDEQKEAAFNRVIDELEEVKKRGMTEFMRTIIYVIDTFTAENQVWGVGRGSSCASYILFLIGVHAVDCIKYNINMDEFFHD